MNKTKRIENTFDVVRIISLFIIGPFNSKKHVGDIFTLMIPLVFTGLCMCFVYAINKFNLAGEGAVNLGGCLAACVAIALRDTAVPGWIAIILCIIVGALAGMLSTAIPAIADQVFHADVCVISLMLNYIHPAVLHNVHPEECHQGPGSLRHRLLQAGQEGQASKPDPRDADPYRSSDRSGLRSLCGHPVLQDALWL